MLADVWMHPIWANHGRERSEDCHAIPGQTDAAYRYRNFHPNGSSDCRLGPSNWAGAPPDHANLSSFGHQPATYTHNAACAGRFGHGFPGIVRETRLGSIAGWAVVIGATATG
jgi:hypothetical protein